MSTNATPALPATPREVAGAITRAWLAYFIVATVAGVGVSLLVGGVYQWLARAMSGGPGTMRFAIMAVSIAINAPISFLAFQWAVRRKVVPATLAWATGTSTAAEDSL
jgi:uncharacterized membrane protein